MSERTLGELANLTVGHVGPMASEYVDEGIPFLRSLNVEPFRLDLSGVKFITPEFHARLQKSALVPGDVVVVRTGEPGTAAVIPDDLPIANCSDVVIVRPGPELDARYLCYLINSVARGYIESRVVGAVQQHFNVGAARGIPVPASSFAEQRRIAGVLGALDDLIDTNRALIANLLRQADSFARKMRREGELLTFAEVCDVYGGATPKTSIDDYWGGPHFWATPTDITALPSPYIFASARTITDAGLASCTTRLHPSGSILMTSRATIGAFALAEVPIAVNQGFIVVEPRETNDGYFLFHEMRRRVPEFLSRANGSTFRELSRGTFKTLEVDWPGAADRQRLAGAVGPLHRAAANLEGEIRDLQRARDGILPLLVSGQIRVAEAAELVGAIA